MNPFMKIGLGVVGVLLAFLLFQAVGPLTKLVMMAVAAFALFVLLPEWRRRKALEALRVKPTNIVWIEVALPKGINNANKRMQSFSRKIAPSLGASKEDLRKGTGQLHVLTIVNRPEGHARPEMRWLLGTDEKRLRILERMISQEFGDMADIRQPQEDILLAIIEAADRERARDDEIAHALDTEEQAQPS